MLDKLVEINLKAQESLAREGNFDKELQELIHSDITPEAIKNYREQYVDLQYVYQKAKQTGVLYELGIVNHVAIQKLEESLQTKSLQKEIEQFLQWHPDYSKFSNRIGVDYISDYKNGDDVSKYSYLQGARILQIQQLKKLLEMRRKGTKLYFYDGMVLVENDTAPYLKFKHIMQMIENGKCKDDAPPNYKLVRKPYSFTRCLEKANIHTKRWTLVSNGKKALKEDFYLALVIAFYLGINTFEEIEAFLEIFGISFLSPVEQINSVQISYIKQAIEAGIHYDNIMYYLRKDRLLGPT